MKYFLATYEILDGEHEHTGAVIFAAATADEAYTMADAEEYTPEIDASKFHFSFGGDGLTACKRRGVREISTEEMQFLKRVGLANRR